jgi:UDP-N-acetylglucosamine 2-epimerase (non-hydrolysing)
MPYTERSRQNLLGEGLPGERIYVTGNPIYEVIQHYDSQICQSDILSKLGLDKQSYFLVTMHRAENVDIEERLRNLISAIDQIQQQYNLPVVISTHPRTRSRIQYFGVGLDNEHVLYMPPFSFFDFITLERNAICVLSDSGTVQEECALFGVPNVTVRDVTERPETIECGSNILSGIESTSILTCLKTVLRLRHNWSPPKEYMVENVSDIVVKLLVGYRYLH